MRRIAAITGVMLVVAFASHAVADIYSFTDEEGVVHFTNMKPRGGKWTKVLDTAPEPGSKASLARGSRYDKVGPSDRSPERYHRYDAFIAEASELYRIPPALIRAVIRTES